MRVWVTCARTEGGVFIYHLKQSEDNRPKTLMSQGGTLAEGAVVAAPIRKLWPANSLELIVSLVNLPRLRKEQASHAVVFRGLVIRVPLKRLRGRLGRNQIEK